MGTVLDALENARHNLTKTRGMGTEMGVNQLHNAIEILNKGYDLYDDIDVLLAQWDEVKNVPEKKVRM